MAITFSNLGASVNPDINANNDATSYANTSWTPPTSGLLIAYVYSEAALSGDAVAPTISGNSLTWTQIDTRLGGALRITLFAANLSGATAGVTTVSFGVKTQLCAKLSLFRAEGADLTGGVAAAFVQTVQTPQAAGSSAAPTLTLAASGHADNRPIVGFFTSTNQTATPRTNWTLVDDLPLNLPGRALSTQWRADAFETTAGVTWTTSNSFGGIAAELKATVTTVHDLTAVAITTGAPTLGNPVVTRAYNLIATGLTTGAPTLGTPAIGQVHSLAATGVTLGNPALDTPAVVQEHGLTATGLTTGAATLDTPVIGHVYVLAADGVTTGAPTLGNPAVGLPSVITVSPTLFASSSGVASATHTTASITPVALGLVILAVAATNNNAPLVPETISVANGTMTGVTWAKVIERSHDASSDTHVVLFIGQADDAPSAGTAILTATGPLTSWATVAFNVSGHNLITPVAQTANGTNASTSTSLTFGADVVEGSLVIGLLNSRGESNALAPGITPGVDMTEVYDNGPAGTSWLHVQYRKQGVSPTIGWSDHHVTRNVYVGAVIAEAAGVHALTAVGITTGSPTLAAPVAADGGPLVERGLLTGAPTLGNPVIDPIIYVDGVTTGAPVLDNPVVGIGHVLTATAITTGAPVVGTPIIGQTHLVTAIGLTTGDPVLEGPAVSTPGIVQAEGLTLGNPRLGNPVIVQKHVLIAVGITTGPPSVPRVLRYWNQFITPERILAVEYEERMFNVVYENRVFKA